VPAPVIGPNERRRRY